MRVTCTAGTRSTEYRSCLANSYTRTDRRSDPRPRSSRMSRRSCNAWRSLSMAAEGFVTVGTYLCPKTSCPSSFPTQSSVLKWFCTVPPLPSPHATSMYGRLMIGQPQLSRKPPARTPCGATKRRAAVLDEMECFILTGKAGNSYCASCNC
jgi:hypothetical protein